MKVVLALLLFSAAVLATKEQFLQFQSRFDKQYKSAEEFQKRYQIFESNLKIAAQLTAANNGSATFGITKFSDLTPEEFASYYLIKNFTRRAHQLPPVKRQVNKVGATPDPTNWDWFQQGVCTRVYNQGQCGSCWAFSATETIESYYALAGNPLTRLSMEQIVDCDDTDSGCSGGLPANAYEYVQNIGGLDDFSDYPYTAGGGQAGQCAFNSGEIVQGTGNFQAGSVSGESGLYQQASTTGPVSVCVDASSWQYYTGGILSNCGNNIDHCVQLTGYNNYGYNNAYWIVRNSWGTGWGSNGFIYILIGQDLCSIGDEATAVSFSS